jgi:hypothetical protein
MVRRPARFGVSVSKKWEKLGTSWFWTSLMNYLLSSSGTVPISSILPFWSLFATLILFATLFNHSVSDNLVFVYILSVSLLSFYVFVFAVVA